MKIKIIIQLYLVIFIVFPVFGQSNKTGTDTLISHKNQKKFNLFGDDQPLEITLQFDLTAYFRTKPRPQYLKTVITFHKGEKDSVTREIGLRTRGEFRYKICAFAPIELNFKNADFGYSDLNKISRIKLVTQCDQVSESENYLLREYLIYKLYNVLTDSSFRVRLLIVNYIDSQKKRKSVRQYGFFIEPVEMLAARTNTIPINVRTANQKNIIPVVMDRVAIFNYMIGNFDWSVPGQHNVKLLKSQIIDTSQLAVAVPYDFDWAGLVNASYAIPSEDMKIKSVRDRIFLGVCRTRENYTKDLEMILIKKEKLLTIINEFPYLNQKAKKDITYYLDEFFNQSVGKRTAINIFLSSCKKL